MEQEVCEKQLGKLTKAFKSIYIWPWIYRHLPFAYLLYQPLMHILSKLSCFCKQKKSKEKCVKAEFKNQDQTCSNKNFFKVKPCMCEMKQEQARGQCSYQQTVAIIQAFEGHMCCTVGLDVQRGPEGPTGAHMRCLESKRPPCQKPISWKAGGL